MFVCDLRLHVLPIQCVRLEGADLLDQIYDYYATKVRLPPAIRHRRNLQLIANNRKSETRDYAVAKDARAAGRRGRDRPVLNSSGRGWARSLSLMDRPDGQRDHAAGQGMTVVEQKLYRVETAEANRGCHGGADIALHVVA